MGKRPFFSIEKAGVPRQRRTRVELPFLPEAVAELCVVVRKRNGDVEVAGPIEQREACVSLLRQGMGKVMAWHERKAKGDIEVHQFIPPGMTEGG